MNETDLSRNKIPICFDNKYRNLLITESILTAHC